MSSILKHSNLIKQAIGVGAYWGLIAIVVLVNSCLAVKGPVRRVESNVITSERDPAVRIQLPKPVQYIGADIWVLYGMADCELHAFVEADAQQNVQQLYWVQFEGY